MQSTRNITSLYSLKNRYNLPIKILYAEWACSSYEVNKMGTLAVCLSVHLFISETVCCVLRCLVLEDLLNALKFKFSHTVLVQYNSYLSLREA
jgi:hypothetical protein